MWARIENDKVAELTDIDPTGRFCPELQWVPCPIGTTEGDTYSAGVFSALVVAASTLEQQITRMDGLVEDLLNATAKRKGYASSDRLAGYSASVAFGADALAFIAWRDAVWIHCTALLNGVMAGTTPIPTDAELLAGLPLFNAW